MLAVMQAIVARGDDEGVLRAELAQNFGPRPPRERIAATLELAQALLADALRPASPRQQAAIITAHGALTKLAAEAPYYNYEPPVLALQIGALLAQAAMPREMAR